MGIAPSAVFPNDRSVARHSPAARPDPGSLVWLIERRHQDGIISNRNYFPGIFEAINWALSTLTTQAETMPRQWVGRTISIFWMFAGVVFVAFYTAQLTTALTVEQIRGAIEGPDDLPGKQVATIGGITAVPYLREHLALVQEFPTSDHMIKALLDKKVEAVVITAPVLGYYATHEGKGRVKMVGPEFETAPAAIMVPVDSPLRRKINRALIALRENGAYRRSATSGSAPLRKASLKCLRSKSVPSVTGLECTAERRSGSDGISARSAAASTTGERRP